MPERYGVIANHPQDGVALVRNDMLFSIVCGGDCSYCFFVEDGQKKGLEKIRKVWYHKV